MVVQKSGYSATRPIRPSFKIKKKYEATKYVAILVGPLPRTKTKPPTRLTA